MFSVGRVAGELWRVDAAGLAALDAFESHPALYQRAAIEVEGPDGPRVAWTYLLPPERAHGPVVPGGDWVAWRGR